MNFNARIDKVKIANYNTKPQNLPQFQNPFLLLSDTEALNKILDGGIGTSNDRVPNPAGDLDNDNEVMGGNVKITPKPRSQMPTQSAERLATGRARITQPTAPIIAPTANRDNPSTSMPDRFPREEAKEEREGEEENLDDDPFVDAFDYDEYDGESGDEGAHGGSGYAPPINPNAPADEMGDEGHSEILTDQRTDSTGSTIHSGTGLLVDGKINSNVGLPTSMNSSLAVKNGLKVKEVKYNPITNKFTLYYGTKLASGRYALRTEITPPDPPPQQRSILQDVRDVVSGVAGANYMSDRLSSRSTRGGGR